MEHVSLSADEIRALKNHVAREMPYAERLSLALVFRLLDRNIEPADVLREINYLEGIAPKANTKPECQFERPPLNRFWHKHFVSARNLTFNVGDHWGLRKGGNNALDSLIKEVEEQNGNRPDHWPGMLAHKLVVEGLGARSRRPSGLTGQWIIYGKYRGQNYYLDLATHMEGKKAEAMNLLEKLKRGSFAEFPFIFQDEAESET